MVNYSLAGRLTDIINQLIYSQYKKSLKCGQMFIVKSKKQWTMLNSLYVDLSKSSGYQFLSEENLS